MQRTHLPLLGLVTLVALAAHAQETNPVRTAPAAAATAQRLIVKLRSANAKDSAQVAAAKMTSVAARRGVALRDARPLGAKLHVVEVDARDFVAAQLQRLEADPDVEYAVVDRRRYLHALPSDPLYSEQWYLKADPTQPGAIDAEHAWDLSTGSAGVVIAALDTGVRFDHVDLLRAEQGGRLLPGYDFVADATQANDGDGRDADPSDPGDSVTQVDVGTSQFNGCDVSNSSWHGTRVAGIIGARTNNAEGMAGGTWSPWILPVRVLGKCGGYDSDILAAMLWAGGIHVDGVPDNPYPAKIENLSLGSGGPCSFAYADVIDDLAARGTLVVASAGNEGGPVDSPANCPRVVAVAGIRHAGTKVGYSSLGPEVTISAPAGNCVNLSGACLLPISTATNFGTTTPAANGYTDQLNFNIGTSFSAPIVAAIAGLMLSTNGNLGIDEMRERLSEGAKKPFPVSADPAIPTCHVPTGPTDVQGAECNCTTATCGAGLANALGAVQAALRPIAAVAVPGTVSAGQDVPLSAAGSGAACGRTIASYAWSIASGPGLITANPTPSSAVVVAPASGSFTVRVVVTDDAGRSDSADVLVTSSMALTGAPANAGTMACLAAIAAPVPPAPVTPSGGAGGSGGTGWFDVAAALALLGFARARGRRVPVRA